MKQANKFMVVPYEEKTIIEIPIKTKDEKISEILNNNYLNKSDKNKLINQLLISKLNKNCEDDSPVIEDLVQDQRKSTQKINQYIDQGTPNVPQEIMAASQPPKQTNKNTSKKKDKTYQTNLRYLFDSNQNDPYTPSNQDSTQLNEQLQINNDIPEVITRKPMKRKSDEEVAKDNILEKSRNIIKAKKRRQSKLDQSRINENINTLNETTNNAQLFLAPAASTRLNQASINKPIKFTLEKIKESNKLTQAPKKSNPTQSSKYPKTPNTSFGWKNYKK